MLPPCRDGVKFEACTDVAIEPHFYRFIRVCYRHWNLGCVIVNARIPDDDSFCEIGRDCFDDNLHRFRAVKWSLGALNDNVKAERSSVVYNWHSPSHHWRRCACYGDVSVVALNMTNRPVRI